MRWIISIVSVVQFAKICGYTHTGLVPVWIIVVFLPWLTLELLILTFNENDGLRLRYPMSDLCLCPAGWVSHSEGKKTLVRNAFGLTVIMYVHCLLYTPPIALPYSYSDTPTVTVLCLFSIGYISFSMLSVTMTKSLMERYNTIQPEFNLLLVFNLQIIVYISLFSQLTLIAWLFLTHYD